MKKRTLSVSLLVLLLMFALTACGVDGSKSNTAGSNSADTDTVDSTSEASSTSVVDSTNEASSTSVVDGVLESAGDYVQADEADYSSAIQVLRDAIEDGQDDEKGQLQSALEKYQEKYASQIESKMSELIGNGEYDSAKQILSDAEEYLTGIETFEDTKVWAEAMISAKIAYNDSDYETAISLLETANDALGGNTELESALTACKDSYREYLTEQINAYVTEGTETALTSADTLLTTAEGLISGDTTVADLKSTVKAAWQELTSYRAEEVEFLTYSDSISEEDQINSYTLTAAVSGTYRIDFSEMVSGFAIKCYVYDSLGKKIGGNEGDYYHYTVNGSGVTVSLTAGETYKINVVQMKNTGDYTMTIGQKKAAATIDDYSTIYDMIEFTDQNIEYFFTPEVTGVYRFDFSEMVSGFTINLNVYNSLNEKQTAHSYTWSAWSLTEGIENGGGATYYLNAGEKYRLNVVQQSSLGSYVMSIGKQNEMRDLSVGSSVSDEINFTSQETTYQFTVETSGTYRFSVTEMDSSFRVAVSVYDDLGYEIADDKLQNSSFTAELTAGETYEIVVSQSSGTGSYMLSAELSE